MQLLPAALRLALLALVAGVVDARPKYDASAKDEYEDNAIITALFRDANDQESRAEFRVGKWAFAGCKYFGNA